MFGFNIGFDTYDVTLEVYIEDKMVQQQQLQAPKEILMMNFMQLAKQIVEDSRPMKIKMSRPEIIWDKFENKQKVLDNEVIIANNAMKYWEERNNNNNEV